VRDVAERAAAETQPGQTRTFNARLPQRMKSAMQRAADLRGQTLSDFVLGSAYERAVATISEENVLRLSQRDYEAFANALLERANLNDVVLARFREAHKRSQQ
jgi:uncharacterized protein (DUF1778 family)